METTTLSKSARQFITLSTLYEMTRALLGQRLDGNELDEESAISELAGAWEVLVEAIPEWRQVANDEEHPAYLRAKYVNMHGVCQQAIALATGRVRTECPNTWDEIARRTLAAVDWQLTNPRWQGIALHAGRVNNTSTSIRNLAGLLEAEMGMQPDGRRAEAIRTAFAQQGLSLPPVMQESAGARQAT